MSFSTFPSTNSIPPATFYNTQGLAGWLNNNPSFKNYFVDYNNLFPTLLRMTSTLSTQGYNTQNVPLAPHVTNLSQHQARIYEDQMTLFRTVYAFNSNAYLNYVNNGTTPVYYRFQTYKDMNNFKASVPLINKMYPFDAMAYGKNEVGSTLGWIVPFPL
jgi:hypothetical protein